MSRQNTDSTEAGRVLAVFAQRCLVWWRDREWECVVPGRLLRGGGIVVGDRAVIAPEGEGRARVERVLERETELRRVKVGRKGHGRGTPQVLAANVAQLVIVGSIREPPFRMGLAERFLVAADKAGLQPLVVVTKLDLLEPEARGEFDALTAEFAAIDVPVLGTALSRPETLAPVAEALAGIVSALVGHSGVGKSSLLNALTPADQAVAEVDARRRRGRHTTSTARMIPLAGDGWVIDSPGVREFGLEDLSPLDLAHHFPGMEGALGHCAFGDCLHETERGCGVREAVAEGRLPEARYAGYLKLLEEVRAQPR